LIHENDNKGLRIMRKSALGLVTALAVSLQSCATVDPRTQDAVRDIHSFASSLQAGDLAGIEARIDRAALEAQALRVAQDVFATRIETRVGASQSPFARALGGVVTSMATPVLKSMVSKALEPEAMAQAAFNAGLTPDRRIPGKFMVSLALKSLDDGRFCVPDRATKRCKLYFSPSANGWKLNEIDEALLRERMVNRS
jgi:hypothetical protein